MGQRSRNGVEQSVLRSAQPNGRSSAVTHRRLGVGTPRHWQGHQLSLCQLEDRRSMVWTRWDTRNPSRLDVLPCRRAGWDTSQGKIFWRSPQMFLFSAELERIEWNDMTCVSTPFRNLPRFLEFNSATA